ncbi:MAG TPA: hypothetical protein VHC22_01820 [Pirellulales bacterium]|nr:hypothetical protein [Pirellulales bacterium]
MIRAQKPSLTSRIASLIDAVVSHFRHQDALAGGYRAMTADERREQEADAWSDATIPLFENERW